MKKELLKLLRRLEKIPHRNTDVMVAINFCGWDRDGVWRYCGSIFFPDGSCHVSGDKDRPEEVAETLEAEYANHIHP